jgi:hypothetical protein
MKVDIITTLVNLMFVLGMVILVYLMEHVVEEMVSTIGMVVIVVETILMVELGVMYQYQI